MLLNELNESESFDGFDYIVIASTGDTNAYKCSINGGLQTYFANQPTISPIFSSFKIATQLELTTVSKTI